MHHKESEIEGVVVALIRSKGHVNWNEIFKHIEAALPLTADDYATYSDRNSVRFQVIAMNLRCHCTVIDNHHDIINVDGGFATKQYATAHNIAEDHAPRKAREARRSGTAKEDNRIGEKYIRAVFNSSIPSLKQYNRKEVFNDLKTLAVDVFGLKYKLVKDKA